MCNPKGRKRKGEKRKRFGWRGEGKGEGKGNGTGRRSKRIEGKCLRKVLKLGSGGLGWLMESVCRGGEGSGNGGFGGDGGGSR